MFGNWMFTWCERCNKRLVTSPGDYCDACDDYLTEQLERLVQQ